MLIEGLNKLNGLTQRKEAYLQYLNQEQEAAEQQLLVLQKASIEAENQLEELRNERDKAEQMMDEVNASLNEKKSQVNLPGERVIRAFCSEHLQP